MKSVIFNAEEVRATLEGRKMQFRAVIKHEDASNERCPYKIGDEIFVKESFCISSYLYLRSIIYRVDSENDDQDEWKSAQHMKQEHSRLTLSIKNIGVERIGDISEEDAIAEGVVIPKTVLYDKLTALRLFRNFWNKKHPKHSFESNPFVWKINFEVVK